MADDSQTTLERAFHERLLAAITEVKQRTHVGVRETLERVQGVGGLQVAKETLRTVRGSGLFGTLQKIRGKYFYAAKRVGRMDLSIEAIALEPRWVGLFTTEDLDQAASRLTEEGFNPPLEGPSDFKIQPVSGVHPLVVQMSPRRLRGLDAVLWLKKAECDKTAEQSISLREGCPPTVSSNIRNHLIICPKCQKLYPELIAAYEHFDQEVLKIWMVLLETFQMALKLGDDDLERFSILPDREEYGDDESYDGGLDAELDDIRALCSWRAVRLGCHIGRFMSAFANTFPEQGDLWLKWRNGEVRGPVSDFVRSVERDLLISGLAAHNLLFVRYWPEDADDILWLPTDGDLVSIPGLVQVDEVGIDYWEEVLGKPPEDFNSLGALYLSYQAAIAGVQAFESGGLNIIIPGLQEQLDRIEEQGRSHQTSLDEMRDRQDAVISQLEHMVAYMSSADRHTSEQTLLAELPGVLYEKLDPQARCLLLGAEQVFRTPEFPAPALGVQALAAAFETQMSRKVVSHLWAYLKSKKTRPLYPPSDWKDVEQGKPVYSQNLKAEKRTLGEIECLLRHDEPAIAEYFQILGLSRDDIRYAIAEVRVLRNKVAHGGSIDIGTAQGIRKNWFRWGGRPGGIFAVLFRDE